MAELYFKKGSYQIVGYGFEYLPTGYMGRQKECQIEMLVDFENSLHKFSTALWCLLFVCEEVEPKRFAYIESVKKHFDLLNDDDESLVRTLEDEGFDFHWLIGLYLDQLQTSDFQEPPAAVEGHEQGGFKPTDIELINLGDRLCDLYNLAAKQIFYKRLARLHQLDKKGTGQFNDLLFHHAYTLGKNGAWMAWLAEGYCQPDDVQQEALKTYEPAGRRAGIEQRLSKYDTENPPFTTEILDWEDEWNLCGSNSANIFVRFTTEQGVGYGTIGFSYLRDEAYLRFPDIYHRIEELEAMQPSNLKKEQPVLAALLAEGCDLQSVAHSHAQRNIDVKGPVIWERVANETGNDRMGEYGDYLNRKLANEPPTDRVKWLQTCDTLEGEVADTWMSILQQECPVLFNDEVDYRIRSWAKDEVNINASNFLLNFRDEMDFLYEGAELQHQQAG